jgi:hypothetical protein
MCKSEIGSKSFSYSTGFTPMNHSPNDIETTTSSEPVDNEKLDKEAAERAFAHYFGPPKDPTPKRREGLFTLSPNIDAEALLANASEDLLSISTIAADLADDIDGSRRSVALALSRMADGVQLMVEGALDHIETRRAFQG